MPGACTEADGYGDDTGRSAVWQRAAFGTLRPPVQIRPSRPLDIRDFQDVIARTYGDRDATRGVPSAVAWMTEEVGELARALRKGTREQQAEEFADVLAWLVTLAELAGIDLDAVVSARYGAGCPKCAALPCCCREGPAGPF